LQRNTFSEKAGITFPLAPAAKSAEKKQQIRTSNSNFIILLSANKFDKNIPFVTIQKNCLPILQSDQIFLSRFFFGGFCRWR
jgi:hypothetical protein